MSDNPALTVTLGSLLFPSPILLKYYKAFALKGSFVFTITEAHNDLSW